MIQTFVKSDCINKFNDNFKKQLTQQKLLIVGDQNCKQTDSTNWDLNF